MRHTHGTGDIAWVVRGAQQNHLEVKADVPAWGGSWVPVPEVQGADLAAGCRWDCEGTGEALAALPTQAGMEGWVQGCLGSPRLRQSCGCRGHTPRCMGDQEGSLAALS